MSLCVSIRCSTESEHLGLVDEEAKEDWGGCWHFEGVYFLSVLVDVICPNVETRLTQLNFLKRSQVPLWYMPNCSASSVDTDPSVDL